MTNRSLSSLLWSVLFGFWIAAAWAQLPGERPSTFDERWSLPPDQSKPEPQLRSTPRTPASETDRREFGARPAFVGKASFYAYAGGKTASGAQFRPHELTAAHRSLPFGTPVRVTDVWTGRSVEVIITDRGPKFRNRVLDLSLGAARVLGMTNVGIIDVRAEVICCKTVSTQ
jgi:peptidoglycan lytic transglycosylase